MDPAWAAMVVAGLAFASAPVGLWLTGRQRRADKLEDWTRQDQVASRLQEVNKAQSAASAATRAQLDQIQTTGEATKKFVDGAYTAQLQVELTVQRGFAAMTRQSIAQAHDLGRQVEAETTDLLAVTEARIAVLVPLIEERVRYMTALADAALAALNESRTA